MPPKRPPGGSSNTATTSNPTTGRKVKRDTDTRFDPWAKKVSAQRPVLVPDLPKSMQTTPMYKPTGGKVGGGKKRKMSKSFIEAGNRWREHLNSVRKMNPKLSLKVAMKKAKKSYKKSATKLLTPIRKMKKYIRGSLTKAHRRVNKSLKKLKSKKTKRIRKR